MACPRLPEHEGEGASCTKDSCKPVDATLGVAVKHTGSSYTCTAADGCVADNSTEVKCPYEKSGSSTPYPPLYISLKLQSQADACTFAGGAVEKQLATDAVTYAAVVGGGTGADTYAISWGTSGCTASADKTTCTVDPDNDTFCAATSVQASVESSKGNVTCAAKASEIETYQKQTVITASDNPPSS